MEETSTRVVHHMVGGKTIWNMEYGIENMMEVDINVMLKVRQYLI